RAFCIVLARACWTVVLSLCNHTRYGQLRIAVDVHPLAGSRSCVHGDTVAEILLRETRCKILVVHWGSIDPLELSVFVCLSPNEHSIHCSG
ncbi:hypothetical protein PMAYCL1PPCAC_21760, partial [Pristionchus mayeri]